MYKYTSRAIPCAKQGRGKQRFFGWVLNRGPEAKGTVLEWDPHCTWCTPSSRRQQPPRTKRIHLEPNPTPNPNPTPALGPNSHSIHTPHPRRHLRRLPDLQLSNARKEMAGVSSTPLRFASTSPGPTPNPNPITTAILNPNPSVLVPARAPPLTLTLTLSARLSNPLSCPLPLTPFLFQYRSVRTIRAQQCTGRSPYPQPQPKAPTPTLTPTPASPTPSSNLPPPLAPMAWACFRFSVSVSHGDSEP